MELLKKKKTAKVRNKNINKTPDGATEGLTPWDAFSLDRLTIKQPQSWYETDSMLRNYVLDGNVNEYYFK